jgi:hypothetical protein
MALPWFCHSSWTRCVHQNDVRDLAGMDGDAGEIKFDSKMRTCIDSAVVYVERN